MRNSFSSILRMGIQALVIFAVGAYVSHLLLAVCVDRALYSDGAFFFVENISSLGYPLKDDEKHIRLIVNIINQAPISIASLIGEKGLRSLRTLFGIGLFFVPLFFYMWCFALSVRARDFSVFACALASLVIFAMPSEIFILNQAFTTLAICWVLMHYALLPLKPGRLELLLILLLGGGLFRSHESMLFWGWGLCFAAFAGMRRENRFRLSTATLHRYYIAMAGAISSLFVLWWQMSHPVGQQTNAYLELLALLNPKELWQGNTRISALTVAALGVLWMSCKWSGRLAFVGGVLRAIAALASAYAVVFAFSVFSQPDLANPFREYEYRFLITFGAAAVFFLAPYVRLDGGWEKYQSASAIVFSGLLAATVWQLSNDIKWDAFRRASIRSLAYAGTILVSPDTVRESLESVGQGYLYKYRWDWTWPVFGLSLHESNEVLRMFTPEGFKEYFVLPKEVGDSVFVPFMLLRQQGFFDLKPFSQACIAGFCQY